MSRVARKLIRRDTILDTNRLHPCHPRGRYLIIMPTVILVSSVHLSKCVFYRNVDQNTRAG
jgi:hypothetical protein